MKLAFFNEVDAMSRLFLLEDKLFVSKPFCFLHKVTQVKQLVIIELFQEGELF
jgi:hypothetical protein